MAFLTDRKRAQGWGSAKSGTQHAWRIKKSSVALLILVPLFVFTFGPTLGGTHDEVIAYFAQPFPAIVAALALLVAFQHFNDGVQTLIEDYVHGGMEKVLLIAMTLVSYGAAGIGIFAIARLAL